MGRSISVSINQKADSLPFCLKQWIDNYPSYRDWIDELQVDSWQDFKNEYGIERVQYYTIQTLQNRLYEARKDFTEYLKGKGRKQVANFIRYTNGKGDSIDGVDEYDFTEEEIDASYAQIEQLSFLLKIVDLFCWEEKDNDLQRKYKEEDLLVGIAVS